MERKFITEKQLESAVKIQKQIHDFFYDGNHNLCAIDPDGIHLESECFVNTFPRFDIVNRDDEFVELRACYRDVRFFCLWKKDNLSALEGKGNE